MESSETKAILVANCVESIFESSSWLSWGFLLLRSYCLTGSESAEVELVCRSIDLWLRGCPSVSEFSATVYSVLWPRTPARVESNSNLSGVFSRGQTPRFDTKSWLNFLCTSCQNRWVSVSRLCMFSWYYQLRIHVSVFRCQWLLAPLPWSSREASLPCWIRYVFVCTTCLLAHWHPLRNNVSP